MMPYLLFLGSFLSVTPLGPLSIPNGTQATVPSLPPAFEFYDPDVIRMVGAEGVQIYECKSTSDGSPSWGLREPLAILLAKGVTIGIHSSGPTWAFRNGEAIEAKVVLTSPAPDPSNIPWLRLRVTTHQGRGALSSTNFVLRIATRGGTLSGTCGTVGELRSVPYSAEYVFLK